MLDAVMLTGWIAAVVVLAVLLAMALVVVAVLVALRFKPAAVSPTSVAHSDHEDTAVCQHRSLEE